MRVGATLTASVTLPLLAGAAAAVKYAGDLESSVSKIRTIRPDFDGSRVYDGLSEMQTRVNQTSGELGDAAYQIVSSLDGIGEAATLNLAEKFGRGAAAAQTDAGQFGKAIIGAMAQFETGVDGADHVMDVFFNTVNRGIVDGAELANEFAAVGKSAKTAGVDLDTLGGLIVGVTKEAGPASQNINDLANYLQKFKTKDAVKGFEALGVQVKRHGQYRPMLDVLGEFKTKFDQLNPVSKANLLQKMLPDMQAQRGLVTLLAQLDAVNKAASENKNSSGSYDAAAEVISKTFNDQLGIFQNTVRHVFEQIGKDALPHLTELVKWLGGYLVAAVTSARAAWESLSPAAKVMVGSLLALAAAAGPVVAALAGILTVVGGVVGAIGTIAGVVTALGGLTPVVAAVGLVAVALVGYFAAAAVGAVALYKAFSTNFGGIRDIAVRAFEAVRSHVTAVISELLSIWQRVYPTLASLTTKGLGVIESLWRFWGKNLAAVVGTAFSVVSGVVLFVLRQLGNLVEFWAKVVDGDWGGAWAAFTRLVMTGVGKAVEIFSRLPGAVRDILARLVAAAVTAGQQLQEAAARLALRFVAGFALGMMSASSSISSAIADALIMAAAGVNVESIGAQVMKRFIGGMKGAAAATVSVPGVNAQDLANEDARLRSKNQGPAAPAAVGIGAGNIDLGGRGGGGGGGRGGSGESKALRAAKLEVEGLEIVADAARRVYERRRADEDFYYSNGLKTLDSFVSMTKALEGERFAALLKVAEAELQVAMKTNVTGKVKENLVAKANEKIEALYDEHNQKLTGIDRDAWLARNAREKQNWDAKIALLEETASGFAGAYQRMADAGTLSFAAAQQRIAGAQLEILLAQQKAMEKQLSHAAAGTDAAAALEGQLDVQRQKIINFRAAMEADAAESQRRDVQRSVDYAAELRAVYESIADMQMTTAEARVAALERSASSTSELLRAERARLDFDLKAEDLRAGRDRAALERQLEYVKVFVQNEAHRAAMVEAVNAQIVASDEAAAARRASVVEDFLNEQREKLRQVSDRAADGISGTIKAGFEDGWRGALKTASDNFFSFLEDISSQLMRSAMFKALKTVFNLETAGESKTGEAGKGPGGGIVGALAKALGIGSLNKDEASKAVTASLEKTAQETRATIENTSVDNTGNRDYNTDRILDALRQLNETTESLRPQQQSFLSGLASAAIGGFLGGLGNAIGARIGGGGDEDEGGGRTSVSVGVLDDDGNWTRPRRVNPVRRAFGGPVYGPGTSTSDSIPAMLSNGEFVMSAAAVRGIGVSALRYMNAAGRVPQRLASGGFAGSAPTAAPVRVQPRDSARPGSNDGGRSAVYVDVKVNPDKQARVRSPSQIEVEVFQSSSESTRRNG